MIGKVAVPKQISVLHRCYLTLVSSTLFDLTNLNRRSSRTTSDVWDYFTHLETEDGPVAVCGFCGQVYQCDRSFQGTGTLWSHLQYRCPSCPFTDHEKRRKLSSQDVHLFSQEDCRRALAKMIIMDEYPFSVVEGEGFIAYSKTLQPQFEPPSRYTVARDCLNLYLEEKAKLKDILRHQRVCLTTDTWTSIQNQNYTSLTAHWINSRWELERKVLNFCFVPDHAGDTLCRMVEECLLEWDIGQVFTLTVDNTTSNNTAIGYLKTATEHWPSTICSNQFLHVRCSCHIMNLVVKKGWEGSNPSVAKIRTTLLFVKSSPGRLGLFKKSFKRLGEECKYFTPYFSRVGGPPTADDWLEARKLISVFKLFYNVIVRFSGQLNVTSTAFFHDFLLMHNKIKQLIRGKKEKPSLASMAENMKLKFEKYWDNNDILNPLLFIVVILDPRYKHKFLEFCFSNIYDQDKAKNFTKKVEDGLRRLFEWYVEAESAASNSEAPHAPLVVDLEECAEDPRKLWASNFKEHLQVIESKAANTELSRYLSELCEKDTDEFNILTWWRRQQNKYPTLSKVAKDVLAVPVSTIASEASFSTSRRVINPQRSSLSPKMVEALICGQSWLRSSPNKIDIRQKIADLHKYEELAQELGGLEFGEA
uniref:Uncharacterized protein n=1 Tax=Avena sativa TaxID=4498 RepID=A0ACD5WTF9_AVESA